MAITRWLEANSPLEYEPKIDLGRRLNRNAAWLSYNSGRYRGYKKAVPKYSLAVLFSLLLMGEIAAATIFKQMSEGCEELVFQETFKHIGRAGVCDECKVKVLEGEFDQGMVMDMALSQAERELESFELADVDLLCCQR